MAGANVINKPGVYQVGTPSGYWPETLFNNENIVYVDCGTSHSAILTEAGRVFSLGGNRCTQPGRKDLSPAHVTSLDPAHIVRIACGREHTLFLSNQGQVFACGWNEDGQLGLGHKRDTPLPTRVLGLPHITRVAAGWFHSAALSEEGVVWVTGCNVEGQLGLGHTAAHTSFVRVPNLPGPVSDVACGDTHTALLTRSRELLLSGGNYDGQLGLGTREDSSHFTPLVLSSPVTDIRCGGWHTVALTEDGRAWAWGNNDYGQLGTGDKNKRLEPFRVKDRISRVDPGCSNTAMFTEEGNVLVCGEDKHGQLGSANTNALVPTPWLTSSNLAISQIAFADQYSLLVVESIPECKPSPCSYPDITDMEKSLMKTLECPVCLRIMSNPIYICANGHSLCGACRDNTRITVCPVCRGPLPQLRNRTLEDLGATLELPCADCLERMPVPRLEGHANRCPRRQR